MDRNLSFLEKIIKKAGKLILEKKDSFEVSLKPGGNMNFVTDIDIEVEKLIINHIKNTFPDDQFLSEENYTNITNPKSVENLWIIDPIDGTNNFANNRNFSCVSIALMKKGQVTLGGCYNPFVDEFYYSEGNGAFLNQKQIFVSKNTDINKLYISTDNGYEDEKSRKKLTLIMKMKQMPWLIMRGSAALGIVDVAASRLDCYFNQGTQAWDNAAAFFIAREAGAEVVNLKNEKIDEFTKDLFLVGNKNIIEKLTRIFNSN